MVKIAIVQMEIKQYAPQENLIKIENYIKSASEKKAEIIVFPEDFIEGPLAGRTELADSDYKYRDFFQELAKKYQIDIVAGSIIEKNKFGIFNTVYYIDHKGNIRGKYQKINLWGPERYYLSFGNKVSVFNTRFGKIGLIVCWDLIFPELFRKMINLGVQIIICPSYWCFGDAGNGVEDNPNSESNLIDSLCVARAFENEIVMIYCNAAGKMLIPKNKKFYKDTLVGHSQVCLPFKGCIGNTKNNSENMLIAEVNIDILKKAEKVYKIKQDLKERILY